MLVFVLVLTSGILNIGIVRIVSLVAFPFEPAPSTSPSPPAPEAFARSPSFYTHET